MKRAESHGVEQASPRVCVREATPTDAYAVAVTLRAAFKDLRDLYTPEAFAATVQPESGVVLRLQEGPVWVAERDSIVVGTVSALRVPQGLMVRGMAVNPEARGLGIGKILLDRTESFAREHGCRRTCLYTTAFLEGAIHLYQESGFQFTGEMASPHGTELLEMSKILVGRDLNAKTR